MLFRDQGRGDASRREGGSDFHSNEARPNYDGALHTLDTPVQGERVTDRVQVVNTRQVCSRSGESIDACSRSDQQLAEAEMSTSVGFDYTATDVDPAYASSQVDLDIAIPVKCLVMDQNIGLVRPLDEKTLRKRRTVVGESPFRGKDRDAALGARGAQGFGSGRACQPAANQQEISLRYFLGVHRA